MHNKTRKHSLKEFLTLAEGELLLSLSLTISKSTVLEDTLKVTLKKVCELTEFSAGEIWFFDEEKNVLRLVVNYCENEKLLNQFCKKTESISLDYGTGLPGMALKSNKSLWIRNFSKATNYPRHEEAKIAGIKTAIAVPIKYDDSIVGVIAFYYLHEQDENPGLVKLINAIARQLGTLFKQKETEASLEESELRFQSVVESIPESVIIINREGKIVSVNEFTEKLFGFTKQELFDQTLDLIMPERYRLLHHEGIQRYLKTKVPKVIGKTIELSGLRKNGTEFPLELSLGTWETEKEVFFCGTMRDISDRKSTAKISNRLADIIQATNDAIASTTIDGTIQTWNNAAIEMYGYSPEEIIGKNIKVLLTEEQSVAFLRIMSGLLKGDKIKHFKTVHLHKNGTLINVSLTVSPLYDEEHQISGISAISRDITEEVKLESELQAIYDAAEVGIVACDAEGIITYFNKSAREMHGVLQRKLPANYWASYYNIYDATGTRLLQKEEIPLYIALKEGMVRNAEMMIMPANQKPHLVVANGQSITTTTGEVFGAVVVLHDITEQKLADEEIRKKNQALESINKTLNKEISKRKEIEAKLEKINEELEQRVRRRTRELSLSEKRFRTLGDAIPQIVWTANAEGRIDYLNERFTDYTGLPTKAIYAYRFSQLIHPDDFKSTYISWRKAMQTGEMYNIEYRMRRHDGTFHWFLVQALPLKDDNNKIVKWFGTNTDIDEQKKLGEKKDEFIGIASHELKTPLTSIKAYMQLLERSIPENNSARNYVLKANTHVDKLNTLISELLDVSKIQAGKLQFSMSHFDFVKLVNESVESVQHSSNTHKIVKEINVSNPIVYGDKLRLEQVFINFLTNAIKYSPDANKVIVKAYEKKTNIEVAVTDFGIGIPKDKQDKLFDRFYRVEDNTHKFSGLGIGLYIASEIVKRHQGKVWVKSEEGKGSTFYFCLPYLKNQD